MKKTEKHLKLYDVCPGYDFHEEIDLPEMHSWFENANHCVPPLDPLFSWYCSKGWSHGIKYGCAKIWHPKNKGVQYKHINGGLYLSPYVVRDEKEVEERTARFRGAMRPYLEDFPGWWERSKKELESIYLPLMNFDFETAQNYDLQHLHWDLFRADMRMWEIHCEGMYASYFAWVLFDELMRERFGIPDTSAEFVKLMRGFDNGLYQVDKKLWQLGQLARKEGCEGAFELEDRAIIPKLEQTRAGREWLKVFYDFLNREGWRTEDLMGFMTTYWLENPISPLRTIRDYLKIKGDEYALDKKRKQFAREREVAVAELLKKVPEQERGWWEQLLRLAQQCSIFSEDHDLYCELWLHAIMRHSYMEFGKRFARAGSIDEPMDIFFLNGEEIEANMMVPEAHDLRHITHRRRAAWEEGQKNPTINPLYFTERASLREAQEKDFLASRDPIVLKGVVGELPNIKPELKADLWGVPASEAVIAEGKARVIYTHKETADVQEGEIVVCPNTSATWASLFPMVRGVITDTGGALCHAAIVAREYGVPCIINTHGATKVIKTGQKIRMDGATGAIYIPKD